MADNMHTSSGNFLCNDSGGVTYAPDMQPQQREDRSEILADVRALADATHDLCAAHRNFWPKPYPIPEDVHCALMAANYGLERVRSGTLKRLASLDTTPSQPLPPVQYSVDLADLVHIADATCELDEMRRFYVDRPDEQGRISTIVARLHDIVERAAGQHAALIFTRTDTVKRTDA